MHTISFLSVKSISIARNSLMNKLLTLCYVHNIVIGDDSLTNSQNTEIFNTVQIFLE